MPTLTQVCGFEFGVASVSGGGLADSAAGSFPTFPAGRTGGLCAQCAAASGGNATWSRTQTGSRLVMRFYFKITVAPSLNRVIFFCTVSGGGRPELRYRVSDGHLEFGFVGGTYRDLGAISTGTWYRIDLDINLNVGGTARSFDCRLDGAAGTQATLTVASGTFTRWEVGAGDSVASAITVQFDDLVVSVTGADYPIGPGKVIGLRPGSDGTHSFTDNDFSTGDAGTLRAASYTDFYLMVDDNPMTTARSTTDNIGQRVARTAGYVEIAPGTTPESGTANGVMAYLAYSSSTTTANDGKCEVRNSAGTATEIWGIFPSTVRDYSENSNFFKRAMVTKPGADWTASEVNAIRWRCGGASDISPVPTWQALMLEVDYPVVSTVERSSAVAATAAIASVATFYSILERALALGATAAIVTAATFLSIFERASALNATGTIATSATFYSILERASALGATGAISSAGEIEGGVAVHTRTAALSATGAVSATGEITHVHQRSAALAATGAIAASGVVAAGHERAVLLDALTGIASAGVFETPAPETERSASLAALAALSVSGIVLEPPPLGYIDFPGIGLITQPVGGSYAGSTRGALAQTRRGALT